MTNDEMRAKFDAWFKRTYGDSIGSDSIQYRYAKIGWQACHACDCREEQEKDNGNV